MLDELLVLCNLKKTTWTGLISLPSEKIDIESNNAKSDDSLFSVVFTYVKDEGRVTYKVKQDDYRFLINEESEVLVKKYMYESLEVWHKMVNAPITASIPIAYTTSPFTYGYTWPSTTTGNIIYTTSTWTGQNAITYTIT